MLQVEALQCCVPPDFALLLGRAGALQVTASNNLGLDLARCAHSVGKPGALQNNSKL